MNKLKPLEELTPSQKEFLGTEFPTPKGGVLRVVGVMDEKAGSGALFQIECNKCSSDSELFPEGFSSVKGSLLKGAVPCSCSKSPQWSETQQRIRVTRKATKKGYNFLGWAEEYKGIYTKLKLYNPATDHTWESTNLNGFMNNDQEDPEKGRLKTIRANTFPDEKHIKDFMETGKFLEGTTFKRNTVREDSKGSLSYWDITCPKCSEDEYTKNGLCSGVFTAKVSHLKLGQNPCRCSDNCRWTQGQREYQLKKVCFVEDLTFIGLVGDYVGNKSKFEWICCEGHNNVSPVHHFLNGTRCRTCRDIEVGNRRLRPLEKVTQELTDSCNREGYTFKGFIGEYVGVRSKFAWVCEQNHECSTSVHNFLGGGNRCPACAQKSSEFGFYKDRTQEKDFLYIYRFKDLPYIKIGRSFEPERRLKQNQTRVNTFYNNTLHKIEQIYLKEGTHQEIYDLEQYLLTEKFLDKRVCLEDGYGSSELLWEDCLEEVMTLVNIFTKEN
jgi:hypothetical protein